jgi:hypothetical protein
MSRDYGKVRAQFWESESLRDLSVQAKFIALYLLTSPHTNAIGCFRLPVAYISHDTGIAGGALEKALAELRAANFAIPCERVPWVYIPNYLRHNPPENPNVWRKCVKELCGLPGEISAAATIAAELYDMAAEERMSRADSKTRVSDDERAKLKQFENGFDTVSPRLTPLPCPNLSLVRTEPTLPDKSGGEGDDLAFEEFWKAYKPPPNSKKPEGRKAWVATAKARPAQPDLLRAVSAYNTWLAEEGRKQKREYPKQHPSTWLRGEVWQGYLTPEADPVAAAEAMDKADRYFKRGKYAEAFQ